MADFITLTPAIGYGGLQDQGTAANPEPTTLELANNAWKAVEIDIEITAGTILTFEFKSDVEGEIHGIGFDTDDDLSPEFFFQLDGTQTFGLQAFDELYTTGSGFQSYEIAVGSRFTGNFDRIVFAMDDDRRLGADSVFRNVRLEEVAVPDVAVEVNGVALGVVTYDPAQDEGLAITPDPATLELTDNAWKKVQINQEITADTVLTFEFKSDVEGEIHGIGFDTDDSVSPEFFFQLDGTQTFGLQSFDDLYTTGSGFQSYEIAVGDFFTGSFENLVFVMDDDRRLGADSVFRNIALTERVLEVLVDVDVDGALFAVESYGGPVQDQGFATSTAAGTELSLTDNAWKSAAVNAVITADTVLSFEFKSDVEGEIHGIGFDTDDDLSPEFFFQLDGTQTFGLQAFDELYTTGSGFQSYAITVGDFFTGTFQNIVFAMDDDRGLGADAVFRNISLGTAPTPVNDAPSFLAGPNQAILEDAGAQTVAGWATGISAGPADEAGQNVSFTVTTDNDALFAVLPTVSADGTLSYELAADANGTATVTVVAIDDGGTANGGVDTSAPQTFTIEAAPVNDAPVIDAIGQTDLTETTDTSNIAASIAVTFTDVDLPDIGHSATVTSTGAGGATAGLGLDAAGLAALITPGAVSKAAGSSAGSLSLGFSAASTVFDYLGDGETVTLSYQLAVDDGDGGVGLQGFDIVITGTSDGIAPIELAEVERDTDPRGFVINGVSAEDRSGRSVSSAGDVNGDGLDDLIVGAYRDDPNGNDSGASFVVFGKADGGVVALSAVEAGTGGFVINGVSADDRSGVSVSSAGDVNGDGFDDLIVGAYRDDPNGSNSGASFVVFGKADGGAVALSAVEAGTGGFVINGVSADDRSGFSVSSAGDVNGDGLDDLIVGAYSDDPNGTRSGASFVVFGKADGGAVELSAVEAGTGGFVINGVSAFDVSGRSVSSAGDVNGDGLDDLIVGAFGDDPNGGDSGASFVVFGKADGGAVALSAVEAGIGGFVINGVSAFDRSGFSVSSAGDVNGDGFDDLIVGAYLDDPNGNINSGASFVVFGKADGGAVALSAVEAGTGGFVINGVSAGDVSGRSVSSAGDVNGDGLDDLIVGASGDDPNGSASGASFVVFGKADGGAVELSAVEAGTGGFVINGVSAFDTSGVSVSSAGDVNGDGFDDLIVGASGDDPNGNDSGASFVVFGGNFTGAATEIGGLGGDVLTGSAAVDVLIGGTGDDTLVGDGGADVLRGGADDDVLAISDLSFAKVDGGNGVDTLRLDGTGQNLDLTIIAEPRLQEIERIDLAAGANTLRLDALELLNLSGETNTLRVLGSTGAVELIGFGWTRGTQITDGGVTFDVLTDGLARIEIATTLEAIAPIAPIELAEVERDTDPRGFVINGVSAGDSSGRSVSSAGDVNGDGLDDLIVGAFGDDPNGSASGASFVVFGKADGGAVALSAVEAGPGGFVINGVSAGDGSGFSVSSAGDVNGDGLDDLIVGAYRDDPNGSGSGASFVVFGKADGGAVALSAVEAGTGGFVINGVSAGDQSGASVSSAGDVNGDGLDDLIVGAYLDDPNGFSSGASFVVFGKADGGAVALSAVEAGTGGFVINGVSAEDQSGRSVSSAGDVNGDGLDDLIVGALFDAPPGASFVVFGKADGGAVALSAVEAGPGGFVINGVSAGDLSGRSVSSAGDVNGDGLDDLIVGAPFDDPNGSVSGASFVVFGKADGGAVALSAVEAGTGGFVIKGVSAGDLSGRSVSSAGDVNGDGLDDLIVGAYGDDPNGGRSGASFVVFGKADGGAVALSAVEAGTGGFVINGVSAGDFSGFSVSSAGDVNGDGFDDLIVGAYGDDPNGNDSGASFVVFGGNFTGAATEVGGLGGDVLTGTGARDVIFAGTGDDTITGNGGADRLSGGQGDDTFVFTDAGGTATITDFEDGLGGQDVLDVSAFGFADGAAVLALASAAGPGGHDVLIQLDADDAILLEDFDFSDLDASDFLT